MSLEDKTKPDKVTKAEKGFMWFALAVAGLTIWGINYMASKHPYQYPKNASKNNAYNVQKSSDASQNKDNTPEYSPNQNHVSNPAFQEALFGK